MTLKGVRGKPDQFRQRMPMPWMWSASALSYVSSIRVADAEDGSNCGKSPTTRNFKDRSPSRSREFLN